MRLAVSNIAWAADEAGASYDALRRAGARGLEFAPGLLLADQADPFGADQAACDAVVAKVGGYGLTLCSMQSLLFGAQDAFMFGNADQRENFRKASEAAIALAARLNVGNLVFGSPANRVIPDGMGADAARDIWCGALRALGDKAEAARTVIALEPNPVEYGTNFMTRFDEALAVARRVDHPAVRVNLDLGALILTGEIDDVADWLPDALGMVNHVHLSAPQLAPLDEVASQVAALLAVLRGLGSDHWVSIEMRRAPGALDGALALVGEGWA